MSMLKKHISAILALVLVCSLLASTEAFQVFAAETGQNMQLSKLYLKEVKMFYKQRL